MGQDLAFLIDLRTIKFADSGPTWIQAMPIGVYHHPVYGKIDITPERVQRFAFNVKNNVRDTELDIDYDHKEKTTEAAGWVKDAEARPNGLWIAVEWTKDALEKIRNKAYRYFSPEFNDEWEHPKSKEKFKDVLFGGGLTNRPFLKDILPINLSEIVANDGGNVVDPKKIRKALGLAEDATDEAVQAKLDANIAEMEKPAPKPDPTPTETIPTQEEVFANELKKLNESNPTFVTALNSIMETNKALADKVGTLETANKLAEVNLKLGELSKGKQFAVAPAVQDKIRELALAPSSDKVFTVLSELVNGGLVELGERGGNEPSGGEGSAVKSFTDKVDKAVTDKKLSYADAVDLVATENPDLFVQYRQETFIKEGAK